MTADITAKLPPTGKITPRGYQGEIYFSCVDHIRSYTGPFFVEASVGAGKTIAMGLVAARAQQVKMSVMVLARTGELVEQNSETFFDCAVKNSIYSASLGYKSVTYPVIVGSEGTVARAMDAELKHFTPDILMIDECHEVNFEDPGSQYMKIIFELLRRNPKLRIVGFTGSPYRGSDDIIGDFWKKCVYRIRTPELVEMGYLVPTFFGYESQHVEGYDLKEFEIDGESDNGDFTRDQLLAMQRKLTKEKSTTQLIMDEVVRLTSDRNAVMITGAGLKHLEQIAECLPVDSYIIITDKTGSAKRREGLKAVSRGEKKYILQIGCLTTGYDEPLIDTSVIMRKIGSLRLLIQLLGRGMRLLKDRHKDTGVIKENHLVLDYSDTMLEMAEKYENPILESAQKQKSQAKQDLIICPVCSTMNGSRARRCVNKPKSLDGIMKQYVEGIENYSVDGRCEWFWSSKSCPKCNTKNDSAARECRFCDHMLVDPNANLRNKHYKDDDFRSVKKNVNATYKR